MNKNGLLAFILVGVLLAFTAVPFPSFADLAKCGCYCGALTDPPCSEEKCKQACGWQGSPGSGGGRRQIDEGPVYDPVADQHRQALGLNSDGLEAFRNANWPYAIDRFREALKLWPDNQDIRNNLVNAEKRLNDERNKKAMSNLRNAFQQQEKRDNITNLKDAFRDQESKENTAHLKEAFREQERSVAANTTKQQLIRKQEMRIADLLQKMKVEQQAIRTLGLYDPRDPEKRSKDFEEWAKLTKESQIAFEKEFMEDLLIAAEAGATEGALNTAEKAVNARAAGTLAKNVEKKIAWFKSKGVSDPYFFDAMRAIAKRPGKEATEKLMGRLHVATKMVEVGITEDLRAGEKGDEGGLGFERMDGLVSVLGFVDPKYKILAADFRFTTSSLYDSATRWVSQVQVNSLTKLTESQLKILNTYNERMKAQGVQLRKARTELAGLSERQ